MPKKEFIQRLQAIGMQELHRSPLSTRWGDWYSFELADRFCGEAVQVNLRVREADGKTRADFLYIQYNCATANDGFIQKRFETEIIDELNGEGYAIYLFVFEGHPKQSHPEYGAVEGADVSVWVRDSSETSAEAAARALVDSEGWSVEVRCEARTVSTGIYD